MKIDKKTNKKTNYGSIKAFFILLLKIRDN